MLLVAACTTEAPSPPPATATGATPTPVATTPNASSSADAGGLLPDFAIERIDLPAFGDGGAVLDVVEAGPGYVAIGLILPEGSYILSSVDAREWSVVEVRGLERHALASIVELDGRLVAVGRDASDIEVTRGVSWVSDDGVTWREAPPSPDLDDAQLIDVIETNAGLVAIGGYPGRDAGGAWTSADGEFWTAATAPDGSFENAFVWSVARGGPGVVAVGWRRNPDPAIGFDPAFWTSADGSEWTLAPTSFETEPGAQVLSVTPFGDELVAVGELITGGQSFAWTSTDGIEWQMTVPVDFMSATARTLVPLDHVLMAAGTRNEADAAIWLSADGRDWAGLEDPAMTNAYVNAGLAIGDDVLLVGAGQERIGDTGSFRTQPTVWYATRE